MARLGASLALAFALVAGTASAAPAAACSVEAALPPPPPNRPHYVLRVGVEPGLVAAQGTMTVSFAPPVATDRLVFRLWPNSPDDARRPPGARRARAGHRRDGLEAATPEDARPAPPRRSCRAAALVLPAPR